MATVKRGKLVISLWMSDTNPKSKTNKVSSIEYIVTAASVTAYNAAADDAARAATTLGVLIAAVENLTLGTLKEVNTGFSYASNLVAPVATDFAFEFDKFLISSRDSTNNQPVKTSIPARNDANIAIESDGTSIDITAPDMDDFVAAYEAVVLSQDLNAVNVIRASISQ
jgi:hypothetical protein